MKLPSGYEISKDKLLEIFEAIVAEKFATEETFTSAFEPAAELLAEGESTNIPALNEEDISFLYTALAHVVIVCESRLRATLLEFEADNPVINSW